MRYKAGQKEETHGRILQAVGRGFRKLGYGGIGVDALAREAGVTSGAFYGHFPSKQAAFEAAVVAGMEELLGGVQYLQREHGAGWLPVFVAFYLGDKRTCALDQACALQALTAEVLRSEGQVRDAFEAELVKVIDAVAAGLPQADAALRQRRAWVLMSMLSGAVTASRALRDPVLAASVADAVGEAALALARS